MSMIAIKEMKMPKSCMECPLFDGEYGDCNIIGETKADATEERAENCPLVSTISIPYGMTNGDMIKAILNIPDGEIDEGLPTSYIYTSKRVLKDGSQVLLKKQINFGSGWWNAPYKGGCNLSEKPTGSESEE